jgi:hypothetical protein
MDILKVFNLPKLTFHRTMQTADLPVRKVLTEKLL